MGGDEREKRRKSSAPRAGLARGLAVFAVDFRGPTWSQPRSTPPPSTRVPKNPHMRTRLLACVSRFLGLLFSPMAPAIAGEPPRVLLVGLGNPGKRYRGTRHNVGQGALAKIVDAMTDVVPFNQVGGVRLAVGTLGSVRVAAALPLSYMNICGGAVGAVARQLNLQPDHLLLLLP